MPVRSGIDILQHYRLNYRKYRLAGPFSVLVNTCKYHRNFMHNSLYKFEISTDREMLFRQGTEWIEVREKIEQLFNQIAPSFFGKIDAICDELIARIYKIRNRQNEVSACIKATSS